LIGPPLLSSGALPGHHRRSVIGATPIDAAGYINPLFPGAPNGRPPAPPTPGAPFVAPIPPLPGGVMLSASTARLVEGAATLGESELVQIKGAEEPVPARRLLGMGEGHRAGGRAESTLVGRRSEMSAVEGLLDRAIDGHGAVVGAVGSPGIGKSRLAREVAAMAGRGGVEVFSVFCESHTNQVHFHAVARLLRAALGVEGRDGQAARDRVRARVPDADPEDVLLLHDLLSIAAPDVELPKIDPDARRRRLTALVNAASPSCGWWRLFAVRLGSGVGHCRRQAWRIRR
jgi:AAA ATPase domain